MSRLSNEVKVGLAIAGVTLFAGLVMLTLPGCTDDEQQKMIDRQKRQEQQEQREAPAPAQTSAPAQTETAPETPQAEATPEAPPEPETQTVTTYYFTSTTERTTVQCKVDSKLESCGLSFEQCGKDGSDNYYCQTGVHQWSMDRTETVQPDSDSN